MVLYTGFHLLSAISEKSIVRGYEFTINIIFYYSLELAICTSLLTIATYWMILYFFDGEFNKQLCSLYNMKQFLPFLFKLGKHISVCNMDNKFVG